MVDVESYLRIFRWRGLNGDILLHGTPDPHETNVALIQMAALVRKPAEINDALPRPLYLILSEKVSDTGRMDEEMSDPDLRTLFLSDLYDFLRIYQRVSQNHREQA